MARLKKWNNQGGSGRGDKYRSAKKSLPNIPQFEKLPESNSISFRLPAQKRIKPDYDRYGDEVWTDWELFEDDEVAELDLYDLEIPETRDTVQDIPNTIISAISAIPDIDPTTAYSEYEIVVKFKSATGQLIVTISSGQAYAARNQLNESRFDFSLVIVSSQPISIGGSTGTINLIQLTNSIQDPAFSLYEWVRSKIDIATNNDGDDVDPILTSLPQNTAVQLPSTDFTWQGQEYNLFYGTGIEPSQICLHCINNVVKFRPNSPSNASYFWTVLMTGDPLPLCRSLLPSIFISIVPDTPTEIDPNNNPSNQFFHFRISTDRIQPVPLPVFFGVSGTADLDFVQLTGWSVDGNGIPVFIIPANAQFTDAFILPLPNPGQTESTTVSLFLVSNPALYDIGFLSQTVTLTLPDCDLEFLNFRKDYYSFANIPFPYWADGLPRESLFEGTQFFSSLAAALDAQSSGVIASIQPENTFTCSNGQTRIYVSGNAI